MREELLELKEGGRKFQQRVSSPRVFRAYMLVKAPVLGVTGAALEYLDTDGARMALPYGRRVKNLFGHMFNAAVLAGAETTSASMIVLHSRNQGAALTAELVDVKMHAARAVTEDLRVLCHEGARYAGFVERVVAAGVPGEETFTATVVDGAGETTHTLELTWRLREK